MVKLFHAPHGAPGSMQVNISAMAFYMGLGLCWAAEEALSFCVAQTVSFAGLELSILYALYLICMIVFGVVLAVFPKAEALILSSSLDAVVLCCGPLGLLFVASFSSMWLVLIGVALFVVGCIALNLLWFDALAKAPSSHAHRAIVGSAAVTLAASLAWNYVGDTAVIALVGASLIASFVCYAAARQYGKSTLAAPEHTRSRRLGGDVKPVVGIAIVAVGFAYMQYRSYAFNSEQLIGGEFLAHLLSLALLVALIFGLKDSEHTISAKAAATLMLFAFFFQVAYPGGSGVALMLAAGCEGMLELVVLLALAELASYSKVRQGFLLGCMLVLFCAAQLVGCVLAAADVMVLTSAHVSPVISCIAIALILAAVWLLNDKTVTAFLWPGEVAMEDGGGLDSDGPLHSSDTDSIYSESTRERAVLPLSFEQKAVLVADHASLTPRESEMMLQFAKGRSSSFIAEQFFVSTNTVRIHITRIYAKCEVHSRQELITLIETTEGAAPNNFVAYFMLLIRSPSTEICR